MSARSQGSGSQHVANKKKGGRIAGAQNFSQADRIELLNIIEDELPLGGEMWDRVQEIYNDSYAEKNNRMSRDTPSLKRQWQNMINHSKPTGDPNCPDHIRRAKRINRIIQNKIGLIGIDDGIEDTEGDIEPEGPGEEEVESRCGDGDDDLEAPYTQWEPTPEADLRRSSTAAPTPGPTTSTTRSTPIPQPSQIPPSSNSQLQASSTSQTTIKTTSSAGTIRRIQPTKRKSNIDSDSKDLREIIRTRLDPEEMQNREDRRAIQQLLQLQIVNLQEEVVRKEEKIERIEKEKLEKIERLEKEIQQLRSDKQLLEMKVMMLEMQHGLGRPSGPGGMGGWLGTGSGSNV